jgi:hypothetical protein
MKLVTDGEKWAIRKRVLFWREYFDFQATGLWWSIGSQYFKDCWTDEATARRWFRRLTS